MNCNHCGTPLRDQARFCSSCGSPISAKSLAARVTIPTDLQAAIGVMADVVTRVEQELPGHQPGSFSKLATAIRSFREVRNEAATAAQRAAAEIPCVTILGSSAKQRLLLVNQLLETELFAGNWQESAGPITIAYGTAASATLLSGNSEPLELPLRPRDIGPGVLVQLPSPLLGHGHWAVASLPDLRSEASVESLLQVSLRSAVVVMTLTAHQLLSTSEQRVLDELVLPYAAAPVMLVVSDLDSVASAADREELATRLERFVSRRAAQIELVTQDPAAALRARLAAGIPAAAVRWTTLLAHLLDRSELLLPEPPPQRAESDPTARIRSMLEGEHRLTQREAIAQLRGRASQLSLELSARLASASLEYLQHEATAHLVRDLRQAGEEAASLYARRMRSLLESERIFVPLGQSIESTSSSHLQVDVASRPEVEKKHGKRDYIALTATIAALSIPIMIMPPLAAAVVSVIGIIVTNNRRRHMAEAQLEAERTAITTQLAEWIDASTERIASDMKVQSDRWFEQLVQALEPSRPDQTADRVQQTDSPHEVIQVCRTLLAQIQLPADGVSSTEKLP